MADDSEPTPPGWYRQPEDPDLLRWWDGDDWTDDTMPAPGVAPSEASPRRRTRRDAMVEAESTDAHPPEPAVVAPVPVRPGAPVRPRRPDSETGPIAVVPAGVRRPRLQAPDGSPGYRRPPEEAPRRPPGPRPAGPAGPRPRHLDEERRRGRVAPPVAPETAQSILKIGVRAGLIAVLIAVVWVGFVKLRDASPGDADTLSKDPTPVTVDDRAPRLDQIVLTLSDLPRGWEARATDPASEDICDGRNPRSVIEPTALQSASFTKGDSGALIGNVVQEFTDDDAARAFMELTARVVDSCREYSADQASVQLSPMDFPTFGDQTFVAEASGDAPGGAIHGALVYVRKANRVASVVTITFGDAAVNTELIEHLTDVVSHRMSSRRSTPSQPIDQGGDGGTGATLPGEGG